MDTTPKNIHTDSTATTTTPLPVSPVISYVLDTRWNSIDYKCINVCRYMYSVWRRKIPPPLWLLRTMSCERSFDGTVTSRVEKISIFHYFQRFNRHMQVRFVLASDISKTSRSVGDNTEDTQEHPTNNEHPHHT